MSAGEKVICEDGVDRGLVEAVPHGTDDLDRGDHPLLVQLDQEHDRALDLGLAGFGWVGRLDVLDDLGTLDDRELFALGRDLVGGDLVGGDLVGGDLVGGDLVGGLRGRRRLGCRRFLSDGWHRPQHGEQPEHQSSAIS